MCRTLQPQLCKQNWFELFPVRSPLLGKSFLFLQVLRCFSSLGALPQTYVFSEDTVGSLQWVSPFGNPRIDACTQLPEAYRSVPRPSSALGAKAFTVSS